MKRFKHESIVRALEKSGYVISQSSRNNLFRTESKTSWCSWFKEDDFAVCVRCGGIGDHDDLMQDYSAGVFPNTIKSLISLMAN